MGGLATVARDSRNMDLWWIVDVRVFGQTWNSGKMQTQTEYLNFIA